jgi:hypothetical protein
MSVDADREYEYPEPIPWMSKSGAMPAMPGAGERSLETLRSLLVEVEHHPHYDSVLDWPAPDQTTTVHDATLRLGACGLLRRAVRRSVELTPEAKHWLDVEDASYLIAVFHANVRYIGELMEALNSLPLSHQELRQDANDRFDLPWTTLDQMRRRTVWLRAAKLIELRFDNKLVITDAGRVVLAGLQLSPPVTIPGAERETREPIELPTACPEVATLIENLDRVSLATRKPVIGYIPRGSRSDVLDCLRLLAGFATPSATRQDLAAYCDQHFAIKDSSVAGAISMLRGTGLIEQTGLDNFSTTPSARKWLELGDNLELARIIHSHILCFGEVLAALAYSDRAPSLASYAARSYGMPRQDVSGMRTRLQILHACQLVEEVAFSRYKITPLGEAFRDSIPLLEPDEEAAPEAGDRLDYAEEGHPASTFGTAADELLAAATDSEHPIRLEDAVAHAIRMLGLDAEQAGGSGRTDVIVNLRSGNDTRRIIVDTKASASGKIDEKAVNFDTLREHRQLHKAEGIALVGPAFSDQRLIRRAQEHGVALISAEFLAEVVQQQAKTPLGPRELHALFGENARQNLVQEWAARSRQVDLLTQVFAALARESANPDQVFGGALTVDQVYLVLRDDVDPRPTPKDIQQALDLLASPLVRGVECHDRKYVAMEKTEVTASRLHGLAAAASQAAKLTE